MEMESGEGWISGVTRVEDGDGGKEVSLNRVDQLLSASLEGSCAVGSHGESSYGEKLWSTKSFPNGVSVEEKSRFSDKL